MGSLVLLLDGVDVTDKVLWDESSFVQTADEGTIGAGTLVLYDPAKALTPKYNNTVELLEDGQRVWYGTVSPMERGREDEANHYGNRRRHILTIIDRNHLFDERQVDGWARSSESDVTRVQAAFSTYRPSVDATTFVTGSTTTMEAYTYKDGLLRDVITDCAEVAGKNYWIDRHDRLHYLDPGSAGSNVSAIALSDVLAAYSHDLFAAGATTYNIGLITRSDDPTSIPLATRIKLKYNDGASSVSVISADAEATYGMVETTPVYDQRAQSVNDATNRANALLNRSKVPEVSYATTIGLPNLGIIEAGQWMALTSGHQSLTSNTYQLVQTTASRVGDHALGHWIVDLELNAPRRYKPRGKGYVTPPTSSTSNTQGPIYPTACGNTPVIHYATVSESGSVWGAPGTVCTAAQAGSWHALNYGWPTTPCGVGYGAWDTQGGASSLYRVDLNGEMGVGASGLRIGILAEAMGIGACGYYTEDRFGAPSGPRGYVVDWIPGNNYPDYTAVPLGGVGIGGLSAADDPEWTYLEVPASLITWDDYNYFAIRPAFRDGGDYKCHSQLVDDRCCGALQTSSLSADLLCEPTGAGYITGGLYGTRNGVNRSFTIPTGYVYVRRIWVNGLEQPPTSWSATDGINVTLGYAPLATDHLVAEWYQNA